jgi:hypothetical protein
MSVFSSVCLSVRVEQHDIHRTEFREDSNLEFLLNLYACEDFS